MNTGSKLLHRSAITPDRLCLGMNFHYPHGLFRQMRSMVIDVYRDDCYRAYQLPRSQTPTTLVDLGACIGCFARLWHDRFPGANITCVEANPKLIPALTANVGKIAKVIQAAVGWWDHPGAWMLDAVAKSSIGGSRVLHKEDFDANSEDGYIKCPEPIPQIRLIQLLPDEPCVVKMDIEGSEYTALRDGIPEQVQVMLIQTHNNAKWEAFDIFNHDYIGEIKQKWDIKQLAYSGVGDGFSTWRMVRK